LKKGAVHVIPRVVGDFKEESSVNDIGAFGFYAAKTEIGFE
jgi:hypothetical protein